MLWRQGQGTLHLKSGPTCPIYTASMKSNLLVVLRCYFWERFTHSSLQVSLSWCYIWAGVTRAFPHSLIPYLCTHLATEPTRMKWQNPPPILSLILILRSFPHCIIWNSGVSYIIDGKGLVGTVPYFLVHKIPVCLITDGSNICSTWHLNKRVQQLLRKCWPGRTQPPTSQANMAVGTKQA